MPFSADGARTLLSWAGELRVFAELGALAPALPALLGAPRGDGHAVLVLPGMLTGDEATFVIRRYLDELGYTTHPWNQGHNWGPSRALHAALRERLRELSARYGRRVSLVGWSLGGIYARELAREYPQLVRQVVTLGSPFGAENGPDGYDGGEKAARRRIAPPVPCTAIYSKSDGVVSWQDCREIEGPQAENIEVTATHLGMGVNPMVLWAIADRLAQSESNWTPFDRTGWHGVVYG
ncbi:MAG: alpha/beta fold hydrolase [Parvibaculum sp.]|uniref:lipase family alpha/beta hydrolase n=1 Tax=Parvibaculum sp. TaxID=2024848 RepID=UPI0027198F09|nr:alpha/beta fold hydrolase [Parvibaculum sp.]MDO8839810.1 alpha/beta fold hydrolase [Parvibaculum sp.]